MSEEIIKHQLSNGLILQLKEIHTAPIISNWIWYRVGSRNETPGKTGLSHWVEHMQFKGTPNFPQNILDKTISRVGGNWNAFTYMDWTTYFETLPAHAFEIGLELEADRMVNSLYQPEEVELERTVVISEREGSENNPLFRLSEAVQLAAFNEHPYRYEVGGLKEDLLQITRDDLYAHYRNYYQPGNALLSIAGDFNAEEMIKKVEYFFDKIPSSKVRKPELNPEVPQSAEKLVDIDGPGKTTFIQIAYRSPRAADDNFFSLTVLDSLLTGPSGLNMFGSGGTTIKMSPESSALVENEISVSVQGSLQATIDPYLYNIHLTVHPHKTAQEVLQAADDQIHRLQDELVTEEEITRAVKQARALFAYGSENITNQAFWLGYADTFASYDWFTHYVDHLAKVTPQEVMQIAKTYLSSKNRVVGIYHPNSQGEG